VLGECTSQWPAGRVSCCCAAVTRGSRAPISSGRLNTGGITSEGQVQHEAQGKHFSRQGTGSGTAG
jgi:hypothetical protein